jgi:hypothetical protein
VTFLRIGSGFLMELSLMQINPNRCIIPSSALCPPISAFQGFSILTWPDFRPWTLDGLRMWSGQNPTGCREIPAAQLTQELAGCPLAVSERPPATTNAPIDVGGCRRPLLPQQGHHYQVVEGIAFAGELAQQPLLHRSG